MTGWYKQQRNLPERAWFKEPHLVQLYMALKSLAYVTDGRYEGCIIRRGSCPTTRADLVEITGMKRMTLDRALKKLISYGEIIVKASHRFSTITICDYDGLDNSESLFRATDGISNGTTDGISSGTTDGTTHLSTIEYKKEDNNILVSPYSSYKKERESEDFVLEIKKRYNKLFDGKLPPCIRLTMPTRLMVDDCVRRFGRQAVDLVFEQVLAEPFSLGSNKTGFQASFQFIFKPANFQQYLERSQLRRKKQQTAHLEEVANWPATAEEVDEPQPTKEQQQEERRQQLLGCVRLVSANPGSSCRAMLMGAYQSGELAQLGIDWQPNMIQ